jgi:hypothetical protein
MQNMITNTRTYISPKYRLETVIDSPQCQWDFPLHYYVLSDSVFPVITLLGKRRHESLNFITDMSIIKVKNKWKMGFEIFTAARLSMLVPLDFNAVWTCR